MAKAQVIYYRGDTIDGKINLRKVTTCDGVTVYSAFPLLVTDTVEVIFPGETASVILSTANVGEITIEDLAASTFIYKGAPAKSDLLKLGTNQAIDVVVTTIGGDVTTFQYDQILTVKDRANP